MAIINIGKWQSRVSSGRIELVCLLATLLIIATLVAHIIFNMFYLRGAYGDAVWFSILAWHNHMNLLIPSPGGGMSSLFNVHISWFFWLPSAISYLLPLDRISFFAWFEGGFYAILGFGFWLLLNELWPARQLWAVFIKCAAAAAFALNGNSQCILIEAHAEIAGPAFTIIFLWGLVRRNHPVTLTAFILALSQREDMGFHIFGVLFLLLMVDLLRRVSPDHRRPVLIYACAAFCYSLMALALKRFVFHDWGVFSLIYTGNHTFSHVSGELLRGRVTNLILKRPWIWGPGLIALFWTLSSRNPYIALGWLAFLPWLLLSLMAHMAVAGNLGLHYGYPFIIAGAWPLLAASPSFTGPRHVLPVSQKSVLLWTLLLLAIQQPAEIYPEVRFTSPYLPFSDSETVSRTAYGEFEQRLPRALKEIGKTRVDWSVYSIAPYALDSRVNRIRSKLWNPATLGDTDEAPLERDLDAVIYFRNGYDALYVRNLIFVNKFQHHYWLPKTRLYLSTSKNIDDIPAFKDLFVLADPAPSEAGPFYWRNDSPAGPKPVSSPVGATR